MSRARKTAIAIPLAVLVALLVAAPFVPGGDDPDGSIAPIGEPTPRAVPMSLEAEIDRVVAEGRALGPVTARTSPAVLVERLVRCAELDGERYCLGSGWTTRSENQVQGRLASASRVVGSRSPTVEQTGDLDPTATLQRRASLTETELAEAERLELTEAALSVSKVQSLRATRKKRSDYPQRGVVMRPSRVREQQRSYWCGPAAMQMIAWGWHGEPRPQSRWASRLGTTTSGTAITDMVQQINERTGWDKESRAGRYITLDISDYSFQKWLLLTMRHIVDYRAPLVLHPVLLKQYYPYLDDDASGHFQVGRGYDKRHRKPTHVGYFEPWNQQRFDPSEPFIARVQWRNAYKSYRANQDHFQQNIGV